MEVVKKIARSGVEGFVNPENSASKKDSYVELVSVLIAFFISLLILSLIGKLLWNNVMVDLFTCVRPAKSVWHILGFFVFLSLLF